MQWGLWVALVVAWASPGAAQLPGLRSATTSRGVFIGNNFIELGFQVASSERGKMGTTGEIPDGFFGRFGTRGGIGMTADANGFGVGTDARIDYFLPGRSEEGFYIVDGLSSSGNKNRADTVVDTSDIEGGVVSTLTVARFGQVQCLQQISMNVNSTFFENVVLITNTDFEVDATNIRFVRSHDPDNTQDRGGGFATNNTVVRNMRQGDNETVVSAVTIDCDAYCRDLSDGQRASVLYFTQDPRAFVDTGVPGSLSASVRNYQNIPKGNVRVSDTYIAIGIDIPRLGPNESTIFTYYTSLTAGDVDAIIGDIDRALTDAPTSLPTVEPSTLPTMAPTSQPSLAPSMTPTRSPTTAPTASPSAASAAPSALPTPVASVAPTRIPTNMPSPQASSAPSATTSIPTSAPSETASLPPTAPPTTSTPSQAPTTLAPTPVASASPTGAPTVPTNEPTFLPTDLPTGAPSPAPTCSPGLYGTFCEPLLFITSLSPTDGPDVGGTPVLIRADNIPATASNVTCRFGATVVEATRLGPGSIRCLSPPATAADGLSTVSVTVSVDGAVSSNDAAYSYFGSCPPTACVNGACSFGRCLCSFGFEGPSCDVPLVAPVIAPPGPQSVYEDRTFTLGAMLSAGSTPVTWQILNGPPGLAIGASSGVISWPSAVGATSSYRVRILARNVFAEAQTTFDLTVLPTVYGVVTTSFVRAPRPAPFITFNVEVRDIFTDALVPGRRLRVWVESSSGARRSLLGTADASGRFAVSYKPFSREAGSFSFGTEAVDFRDNTVQGTFSVLGLEVTPASFTVRGNPDVTLIRESLYRIRALGDSVLTDIAAELQDQPLASAAFRLGATSLLPGEAANVSADIVVSEAVSGSLSVFFTSAEGVAETVEMSFAIRDKAAVLRAEPASLAVLVPLTDTIVLRSVNITNFGDGNTGQLQLFVPGGQSNVQAGSSAVIPNIAPGESRAVSLAFRAASLGLGDSFSGTVAVSSPNVTVVVPVRATAVSTLTGDLTVVAQDESTYFAAGTPPLAGARISLQSQTSAAAFSLVTDGNGEANFEDIPEDLYDLTASKEGHRSFRRTVQVDPAGSTVLVFLSRTVVSYTWSVTEVEIIDRVQITVEATFETFVPAPVVVWEPTAINLDEIREQGITEIPVTVTNYGLIAAEDVNVVFPEKIENIYFIKPEEQIGRLPANTTAIWPIKVIIAVTVDRPGWSDVRVPARPENIMLLKEATAADGSTYVSELEVAIDGDFSSPAKMLINEDGTVDSFFVEGQGGYTFTYDPVTLEITGDDVFDGRRLQATRAQDLGATGDFGMGSLLDFAVAGKRDPESHMLQVLDAVQHRGGLQSSALASQLSHAVSENRELLSLECFLDIACLVCRELVDFVCEKKIVPVCKRVKRVKRAGPIVQEFFETVCEDVIEEICDFVKETACFTCDEDIEIEFCSSYRCGPFFVEACVEMTVYPIDGCEVNLPLTFPGGGRGCGFGGCIGGVFGTAKPFVIDCEFLGSSFSIGRRLEGTELVDADMMEIMRESRRRLFTGCDGECPLDEAKTLLQAVDARQLELAEVTARLNDCAGNVAFTGLRSIFPCVVRATLPSLDLFVLLTRVVLCELSAGDACVDVNDRVKNPGLANLLIQAHRVNVFLLFAQLPYGALFRDLADTVTGFEGDSPETLDAITAFRDALRLAVSDASDGAESITAAEVASLKATGVALPTEAALDGFAARWNRSLGYYSSGVTILEDLPTGVDGDFFDADLTEELLDDYREAAGEIETEGYLSFTDAWSTAIKAQQREEAERRAGVCASVRIQISQELTLTRIGFEGTLEIKNDGDLPLTDVQVNLRITPTGDATVSANDLFVIGDPQLSGLSGVDGDGTLPGPGTGSATWLIIPLTEAAPMVQTDYDIGGVLRYKLNGTEIVSVLSPDTIAVRPDPQLYLTYFFSRDVFADDPFTPERERSVPFYLAVLIENRGFGTAFDLKIESSQPEIIENEKGLLISFEIIGSRVDDEPRSNSLTIDFGDVEPQSTTQGIWELVSTLRGTFSNFSATFEYSGPLDDSRLSLIEEVTIYELTHLVRLLTDHPATTFRHRRLFPSEGLYEDDGLVDFLCNLRPDAEFLPDTVFTSDNGTQINVRAVVDAARVQSSSTEPSTGVLTVVVDMDYSSVVGDLEDWVYLRFSDPAPRGLYLQSAYRPDLDYFLLVDENAWQTAWTEYFLAGPEDRDFVHLFDLAPAPQYVLTFGSLEPVTSLQVTNETEATLSVSWDPVVGANNYRVRIKRPGEPDSAFVIVEASLTTTEYVVPNLASGRSYIVNVQAGATTSAFELAGASVEGRTLGSSSCGNGVIDDVDEECDDGPDNGVNGACTEECALVPVPLPTAARSSAPSLGPTGTAMPSASASPTASPASTLTPTMRVPDAASAAPTAASRMPTPVSGTFDSAAPSSTPVASDASAAPTGAPSESLAPTGTELCSVGVLDKSGTVCCASSCSECGGCGCKESLDCCPRFIAESGIECMTSIDVVCVVGTYIFMPSSGSAEC